MRNLLRREGSSAFGKLQLDLVLSDSELMTVLVTFRKVNERHRTGARACLLCARCCNLSSAFCKPMKICDCKISPASLVRRTQRAANFEFAGPSPGCCGGPLHHKAAVRRTRCSSTFIIALALWGSIPCNSINDCSSSRH